MKNAKRFSWSEYFGNADKVNQTHNGTALYDTTSPKNYYVFVCTFKECKENGAIYIERNNEIYTLLEDSIFSRCKSTSQNGGGSVYFYGYLAGHIVQQRNCYFKSIATSECMAFQQYVQYYNYAFEISVSNCGESVEEKSTTFGIIAGDVQIANNNITYNKCRIKSSIYSYPLDTSGYCNFSTFRENNQTGSNSLVLGTLSDSEKQTVSYCNVIENKCGTDNDQVLFRCKYNTTIDHCAFLKNTAVYLFYIDFEGFIMTISDSFVDSNSTSGLGTVKFERDHLNSETISIALLDAENCFIEPKVMTAKVSYFCALTETSPALFVKK